MVLVHYRQLPGGKTWKLALELHDFSFFHIERFDERRRVAEGRSKGGQPWARGGWGEKGREECKSREEQRAREEEERAAVLKKKLVVYQIGQNKVQRISNTKI